MNEVQKAAFEMRLEALGPDVDRGGLPGAMLAACSAHDPDPARQVEVLRRLVGLGGQVGETDKNGVTPLHRAARFRSPWAVGELIAQGADVNAVDRRSGSTALHRAVKGSGAPGTAGKQGRAIEVVALLLDNGADPRTRNKMGKTALDYVVSEEMKAVFLGQDTSRGEAGGD